MAGAVGFNFISFNIIMR
jgi:hypothetical protein